MGNAYDVLASELTEIYFTLNWHDNKDEPILRQWIDGNAAVAIYHKEHPHLQGNRQNDKTLPKIPVTGKRFRP
jgi:hypothetical protein